MARIRKFCAYRRLERPNCRKSKYKKKNYVRATPSQLIVRFQMGNLKGKFERTIKLVSKNSLQIRQNAIESARQTSNKVLEGNMGKNDYHFKIRIYPFHHLRENPLAAGAGADRMSTGMKHSFGKPIGLAAQVRKGQTLMEVSVNKQNIEFARKALKRASYKMPGSCSILEQKN